MRGTVIPFLVLALSISALAKSPQHSKDAPKDSTLEAAATSAAESWLADVDAGRYEESWDAAAEMFKSGVKKDQWPQMLTKVRKPLGSVTQRRLLLSRLTNSLPNTPNGKHVVMQFQTAFEKKKKIETVVSMLEKDGVWRVSSYVIK